MSKFKKFLEEVSYVLGYDEGETNNDICLRVARNVLNNTEFKLGEINSGNLKFIKAVKKAEKEEKDLWDACEEFKRILKRYPVKTYQYLLKNAEETLILLKKNRAPQVILDCAISCVEKKKKKLNDAINEARKSGREFPSA